MSYTSLSFIPFSLPYGWHKIYHPWLVFFTMIFRFGLPLYLRYVLSINIVCILRQSQSCKGLSPPHTPPYVPFMAYGGFTANDWTRNLELLPQLVYLSSPDTLSTPPHRLRGFELLLLSIPQSRLRTFQYFLALLL